MVLNPDEQESQIVAPLHSPPPEQNYLDNAFPGGIDGYEGADVESSYGSDGPIEEAMLAMSAAADERNMDTQPLSQHTFQQDGNKSLVEETQFADIEKDTQAMRHQEGSVQRDTQNASCSARSFVGETQYAGIEIDTQANEDATQFADLDSPSQIQAIQAKDQPLKGLASNTKLSPAKFFSKPTLDDGPGFKFGVAPHTQKHRGPVQNPSLSKVAAPPEKSTKISPEVTAVPKTNTEPPAKASQSMQPLNRAPLIDLNTPASHSISNIHSGRSAKPIQEKEVIPTIQDMTGADNISDAGHLPPNNPVQLQGRMLPRSDKTSVHHNLSDVHTGSSIKASVPEKVEQSVTQRPSGVQNNAVANPLIQAQTKRLKGPFPPMADTTSNSRGISSQSVSDMDVARDTGTIDKSNQMPVAKVSHNQQSKPAVLPSPRQDTLTPQRPRLRQKSSNQMNRVSVKTKFNVVHGNLVKKAPFPDAFSDEPKLQVYRDRQSKAQIPPQQLNTQPQYSEHQRGKEELPTRMQAASELELSRLHFDNNPTEIDQLRGRVTKPVIDHPVVPVTHSRAQSSTVRAEDSIMTSVENEDNLLVNDSEESHQSVLVPQFQPNHHIAHPDRCQSVHQEPPRPFSRANISRTQTPRTQAGNQIQRNVMTRPLLSHDLEPQGVSAVALSRGNHTKVTKVAVHSRGRDSQLSQIGDHVSSGQTSSVDLAPLYNMIGQCNRQQVVIQTQENDISILNAKLQDAEAKLQDTYAINAEFEARENELSKRVERLNDLSNRYKQHINEVVICQKSLRQDSKEMKTSIGDLRRQESKEREAQISRMRNLLEEIKQAQREQAQRDFKIAETNQLQNANERLKANIESKLVELQQERYRIEQLQKQINNGDLDRHKEVMEILQKPQIDTLGELTKEDGILNKVLNSSERVQGKFDEMSKTITNSLNHTSEWPQTLTKILEEFYSKIQTKLDDNGNKDTTFQESTVKLFDDLKERLDKINGDIDEKTKLSEQLNVFRESNATLKANLDSKEAESENTVSRMNELTRELADIRSQLMNKTEQLAISNAQPREDPELKRKVDDLTTETSRLQTLLTAANDEKRQAENNVQTHQATITATQNQLREIEDKLRDAESAREKLEGNNRKFQIECKSATERVRQETTQLALSQRKDLVAQHDSLVNNLRNKQADTERKLQEALEKSKTSKETTDEHVKTISRLESKLATYKDQLLQQKLQLQNLEETSISTPQFLKREQEHKHEILSIRQEHMNQHASLQAYRNESLKMQNELEGVQKRLRGMNEQNEQLTKENDRLRKRLEDINAMTDSSQKTVGGSKRVDDNRPSRRPAERKPSNFHHQAHDKVMGGNQHKVPESKGVSVSQTASISSRTLSSSAQGYSDNVGGSQTPIKPFSNIASLETSPLTDLEGVIPELPSAHSCEDLQLLYNKNRQVLNDEIKHTESIRSKYYSSHGQESFDTPASKLNKVILASEPGLVSTPTQASRAILSVAEESIQRRTSKPIKSAMKKSARQDSFIPLDDEACNQKDDRVTATFVKTAPRNNRGLDNGLQTTFGTGASSYNRIASGKPNVPNSRVPEPRYEPTPDIKRNAMKRARSNSSLPTQNLQPVKPAKAPRIDRRQQITKTIIPDSQDRS